MPPKSSEEQQQILKTFREECLAEGVIKPESEAANDDHLLLCVTTGVGLPGTICSDRGHATAVS